MLKQCPITSHHVPSQCVRCRYFFLYCHSEALPHHDPIHVMLTFHVYRHFILYCNPFPLPFISIDVQVCCVAIKKKTQHTCEHLCVHFYWQFVQLPSIYIFHSLAIHVAIPVYCHSFMLPFISITVAILLRFICSAIHFYSHPLCIAIHSIAFCISIHLYSQSFMLSFSFPLPFISIAIHLH